MSDYFFAPRVRLLVAVVLLFRLPPSMLWAHHCGPTQPLPERPRHSCRTHTQTWQPGETVDTHPGGAPGRGPGLVPGAGPGQGSGPGQATSVHCQLEQDGRCHCGPRRGTGRNIPCIPEPQPVQEACVELRVEGQMLACIPDLCSRVDPKQSRQLSARKAQASAPCCPPKLADASLFAKVRSAYSNRICNAQELAQLVVERYETGLPIGIVRVSNHRTPTYLVTLQGTEIAAGAQGTNVMEDFLEAEGRDSYYKKAVMKALKESGIRNANVIIAGHSLGGAVAQNVITDPEFYDLGLRPVGVITFGSFGNKHEKLSKPLVDTAKQVTVRFEAQGDTVLRTLERLGWQVKYGTIRPLGSCSGPGQGTWDQFLGDHNNYQFCSELRDYNALGHVPSGRACLELDRASFKGYPVPNSRAFASALVSGTSEEIGEEGMARMAATLGYRTLLAPQKSTYPQGYDGVYFDDKACAIVLGEAKGGYNGQSLCQILGTGYGFRQGTLEWAEGAACRVARSRTVQDEELYWALLVGEELGKVVGTCGKVGSIRQANASFPVRVEVFHTENLNGRPGATKHYVTDKSGGCVQKISCECR